MNDLGGDTRDHISLSLPLPQEHGLPAADTERGIRRYARHGLAAGTTILIGTYLATLAAKVAVGDNQIFAHPTAQVFAVIGFISLHTLGTSLVLIAGLERLTRPQRTLIRRAMARADMNATINTGNQASLEKLTKIVTEMVDGLHYTDRNIGELGNRITALEASVAQLPEYGTIVADGYRLGRHSAGLGDLDELAGPDPGRNHNNRFDR